MADRTMLYTVRYVFGPYSGEYTVTADSHEEAIRKTRAWARRQSAIPIAAESYRVVDRRDQE